VGLFAAGHIHPVLEESRYGGWSKFNGRSDPEFSLGLEHWTSIVWNNQVWTDPGRMRLAANFTCSRPPKGLQ